MKVSDLIDPVKKDWDSTKIKGFLDPHNIPMVQSLHLSRNLIHDGYCWNLSISGKYSVKSVYMLARSKNNNSKSDFLNQLLSINPLKEWKVITCNKLSHFLWQIMFGAMAINERLIKRHIGNDPSCPSGCAKETINHTIFTCPPAMQCWVLSTIPYAPRIFASPNLHTNMDYLLSRTHSEKIIEESTRDFSWLI